MAPPCKEKFEGCLIGQCLGDALGFPTEGFPALICQRYVNDILRNDLARAWKHHPYKFGQYNNDSQLTRELLKSLIQNQGFNPEDFAQRIVTLYKRNKLIGLGKATETAARQLVQGIPWNQSGTQSPEAGNGSILRAVAVGLFYFDDRKALIKTAYLQSTITHQDSRCSAAAVVVATAIALALGSKNLNPKSYLEELRRSAASFDARVAAQIQNLIAWLPLSPREAALAISQAGIEKEYPNNWPGISPFVIPTILWGLYTFLKAKNDYWETICLAIEAGGDVDTTAAIAGAISGAYLGLRALPEHLAKQITDQDLWKFNELLGLADQCYNKKIK